MSSMNKSENRTESQSENKYFLVFNPQTGDFEKVYFKPQY